MASHYQHPWLAIQCGSRINFFSFLFHLFTSLALSLFTIHSIFEQLNFSKWNEEMFERPTKTRQTNTPRAHRRNGLKWKHLKRKHYWRRRQDAQSHATTRQFTMPTVEISSPFFGVINSILLLYVFIRLINFCTMFHKMCARWLIISSLDSFATHKKKRTPLENVWNVLCCEAYGGEKKLCNACLILGEEVQFLCFMKKKECISHFALLESSQGRNLTTARVVRKSGTTVQ